LPGPAALTQSAIRLANIASVSRIRYLAMA
jgi:hypothetical protein